jgi:hypothetical protein
VTRAAAILEPMTLDEVAKRLHRSRRWLQDFLRTLDNGSGRYWKQAGVKKLFSEEHFAALFKALPNEATSCPSSSSRPAKARHRSIAFEEPTSGDTWTDLQNALKRPRRGKPGTAGNEKSNVVSLPRRAPQPSQGPR